MRQTMGAGGSGRPQPLAMTGRVQERQATTEFSALVDSRPVGEGKPGSAGNLKLGSVEQAKDSFFIDILQETVQVQKENLHGHTVVLVKSNILGQGDETLGDILMKGLMYSLTQLDGELKSLVFINGGVMLTTSGSDLLDYVRHLERSGVEIISCASSLEFYGLRDKLEVGREGSIYTIVETMLHASKVISL